MEKSYVFLSHGKALAFSAHPQNYWSIRDKQMCYKCQILQKFRYLLKILPSYIGTVCETPSPESSTIPVVLPEAYKDRTAWMATYIAGVLKVSNIICNRNNPSGTKSSRLYSNYKGITYTFCKLNKTVLRLSQKQAV